jgi:FkbM family methyltransferase
MKPNTTVRIGMFCVVAVLPLSALFRIAQSHHVSIVMSHYLHGKAGNCTLRESFEAEALSRLQGVDVETMRSSCRVLRREDRFALWTTPYGEFWMPAASDTSLIYDLAEQKRNIYGTRIRSGDIVLDAGANVGVFTRKALWAGAAKVIAIEPGPENLECLRRNFAAEIAAGRVVLYPKGVWNSEDVLKFNIDPKSSAKDSFVMPIDNAQFLQVPVTTVDHLVAELNLPKVDFIKMDIEGAEQRAVAGARNTIAKYRPRMALCIYHVKGDEIMVPKLVAEAWAGYQTSKTCFCSTERVQPEVQFFY